MDRSRRLEPGRAAFNRGAYFEAHELWEEAWRALEGAERIFVQGLIQIAAGLHHLQRNRPRPAAGLLRKGLDKLSRLPSDAEARGAEARVSVPAPAPFADLAVDELASAIARVLAALDDPRTSAPPDTTTLKL